MRAIADISHALACGLALAAVATSGCRSGPSCLASDEDCLELAVCVGLSYSCDGDAVYVGSVGGAPGGIGLADAEGVAGDWMMQNSQVTAVFDDLGTPHDLAPSGGNLLDFGPTGGDDELVSLYQLAGILPDDTVRYDERIVLEASSERAVVVLRGQLDGRDDVEVATRYELRACEPGLRVRTELVNRSPDIQAFLLADSAHWGKRTALPFAPQPGQGFLQPELDLIDLGDAYYSHSYVVARPAEDRSTSYGFVACDRDKLDGLNDPEISALGLPFSLVRPGEAMVLERFLVASGGRDLDGAVSRVAQARTMLHGDPPARRVSGRVLSDGIGFGGDLRRASVLIVEDPDGAARPLSMVVAESNGEFSAAVPSDESLGYEVWSFGRPVARGRFDEQGRADPIDIEMPGRLIVIATGTGDESLHAMAVVEPADQATREAVTGSWFGRFGTCAPWLGPSFGASPACDRFLVEPAGSDVEIPAGNYHIWITAGPEMTLAQHSVTIAAGEVATVDAELSRLDVRPPGFVSADLHVHGRASFDSSIPDRDRVLSFVAAGIDVIAATDHDYVADYRDAIAQAGVGDQVVVMGGLETTGLIPFMDVPDNDLPRVIGHFNFWPIEPDPTRPRGGAPWDERLEPGELFDIMDQAVGPDGIMMMNHPWDDLQFGRDLGYLRAIDFDPRLPIPDGPDGSNNGLLMRAPGGGHRNIDFDTIELMNGAHLEQYLKARVLWFSLIGSGHPRSATANSDSHSLIDAQLGYGRTLVDIGGTLEDFDVASFDGAVRDGRTIGGNGVVVWATIGQPGSERSASLVPHALSDGDVLTLEVRAPPWIPVSEIRVITSSGERVIADADDLDHPADPLGVAQVVRYRQSLPLADLVTAGSDDWMIIEAGLPPFAIADLDDDGVPDTSDNNGDGLIDEEDIEDPDDDSGPLEQPGDPDDPSDPRYFMTRVVPRAWPLGFVGPILIDTDGGGWQPPEAGRR